MKYLIAVATVAVALVLTAASAQAQALVYCSDLVGPTADNVLTPNEKSRHRFSSSATRACADSNDNYMRAIWLNAGKSGSVAYAGDVRPLYNEREGVGLVFSGAGDFRCASDGTHDIWREDPKTESNTISIVCGAFTNRPPVGEITGMPPEVHPDSTYKLTANVTDPDGDALSFNWTSGGTFSSPTAKTTDWTAPGPFGEQDTVTAVAVEVKDGYPQHERVFVVKTTVVSGAGTARPRRVTGVGVAPGNAQLVVTWTAVANATGYKVQWKSGSQGYNTGDRQATVTSGSTTSHTISGLTNGTPYTVQVIATRTGVADGPPSAALTGTPTANATARVTGVGVAPGNAQLVVTWTAVANATGYKVQWKSGSQGYNTGDRQATVTSGSTTSHTISGLTNGTPYTVQVIATRTGVADGPPSAALTGTPTANATARVTGVGVAPGNAQLVVTWTAVANATGYKVQWKSGSQGYNTGDRQATVTSGSTTSHTISGLTNGTPYTVQVIATRTGADDGPPSAPLTRTPTASPPPPAASAP